MHIKIRYFKNTHQLYRWRIWKNNCWFMKWVDDPLCNEIRQPLIGKSVFYVQVHRIRPLVEYNHLKSGPNALFRQRQNSLSNQKKKEKRKKLYTYQFLHKKITCFNDFVKAVFFFFFFFGEANWQQNKKKTHWKLPGS